MKTGGMKRTYIILALLILVQIVCMTFRYSLKNSRFIDEFYAYGIANNYFNPFIGGVEINSVNNDWLTGDDFKYYIRTNENTNFRYDSVLFNASNDTAAPLYSILLHTICSFFPNEFSWWWGFWLNIACFIIGQIFLYKLIYRMTDSPVVSVLGCLFYGFTMGCVFVVSFVRNYEIENACLLAFLYYSTAFFDDKEKIGIKTALTVFISAVLAFFAHYLFIVFAFFYTAAQCLLLLCKKKFKEMFIYGASVLFAILISFAVFPASFKSTFGLELWRVPSNFILQMHMIMRSFVLDVTGCKMSETFNLTVITIALLVILLPMIFLASAFLFRNEEWWKKFLRDFAAGVKRVFSGRGRMAVCLLFAVAAHLVYVAKRVYYPSIGIFIDRYLFLCMAPFVAAMAAVIAKIIRSMKKRRLAIGIVAVLMVVSMAVQQKNAFFPYVEVYPNNDLIAKTVAGENCLLVQGFSYHTAVYCQMLEDCSNVYLTSFEEQKYLDADVDYEKLYNGKDYFYVLINERDISNARDFFYYGEKVDADYLLDYFKEKSGCSKADFCGQSTTSTQPVSLYRFEK